MAEAAAATAPAAAEEQRDPRDWRKISKVTLDPIKNDDVFAYPHPKLGGGVAPIFGITFEDAGVPSPLGADGQEVSSSLHAGAPANEGGELQAGWKVQYGPKDQVAVVVYAEQFPNREVMKCLAVENTTTSRCKLGKQLIEVPTSLVTAIAQTENKETDAVIKWLNETSRFKHLDNVPELLEEYRTAQEKDTLAARNMRKSFNKNAYTHALVQPAAFASNSASAKKELRELELARTLNELYLCGLLTQDCNEAKELLTMHDGQAAAALARVLSKPIIDKVLPGACGTEGTLTNFDTERTKAKKAKTTSDSTPTSGGSGLTSSGKAAASTQSSSKGKGKGKGKGKDKSTTELPSGWPDKYKKEIKDTKEHAIDERADDPPHYAYWKGREKGHAPRGRKWGAAEGEDFGAAGKTTKLDATVIKERAEVSTHLMKDEMEEMKQVLEAKSKRVAQLEDHNRKLTMAVQQHRQHGDIYFTKVKGGFEYVQGMYMMQCKNSKVSPMKTESREPPSFKRSFEEFVADQNQSFPSSSQTLDMSELSMDL